MSRDFLAATVKALPYSGIRRFFNVAAEMKDVVSLGVGEPDFFTPWNVREEGIWSLEHRRTVYSSNAGQPALRAEIARYLQGLIGVSYDPKTQVIVTVGVSEAIDIALRAVMEPGDEVLVVEPCYVSYQACVTLAGGVAVPVPVTEANGFRVTRADIEPRITPRTKAILFGYPNNPTGAVMTRADWEAVASLFIERDLLVLSDEVYGELTFPDGGHASIAALPGMRGRTVVMNGFSKAYAMTGWRLGYACGPADIIAAMIKIHQYVIMCAPTTAQYAGIEALKNGQDNVTAMRRDYNARRRFMLDGFAQMGLPCYEPRGAFYLFPSVRKAGLTSEAFCMALLESERLAVVPGTAFGPSGEGHVRCCYAYSIEELREALRRLGRFMERYR